MKDIKLHQRYRLILLGLILLFFSVCAFTMGEIIIYRPDDYVFSLVVVIVLVLFGLFESFLTIKKYKKELSLLSIGFTPRGYINPIPLIAIGIGVATGLILSLLGIILCFIKEDMSVKCSSLVILVIGLYLLINCVFYLAFIIYMNKLKNKN